MLNGEHYSQDSKDPSSDIYDQKIHKGLSIIISQTVKLACLKGTEVEANIRSFYEAFKAKGLDVSNFFTASKYLSQDIKQVIDPILDRIWDESLGIVEEADTPVSYASGVVADSWVVKLNLQAIQGNGTVELNVGV